MISVIIPVYNAQKTIADTIESVVRQTEKDFEVLLIDDGSSDVSSQICQKYSDSYGNCKYFRYENGGVSKARWRGVENASGDWITFVDADDVLPKDALCSFFENVSDDVDIVVGDASFWNENFLEELENPIKIQKKMLNSYLYKKMLIDEKIIQAPWGKLFRRKLFDNYTFNIPRSIINGEDLIMNLRLAANAKNVLCVPRIVYMYRAPTLSHRMGLISQLKQLLFVCSSLYPDIFLSVCAIYKFFYRKCRKLLLNR